MKSMTPEQERLCKNMLRRIDTHQKELSSYAKWLAENLLKFSTRLDGIHHTALKSTDFNTLGEVQSTGAKIDNLCGKLGAEIDALDEVIEELGL